MIVDIRLKGRSALIIGGGGQALKRARGLLGEGCSVSVVAKDVSPEMARMASRGEIRLETAEIADARILEERRPFLVVAATDDPSLNREMAEAARKMGILAYASDSPESSDFASVSVIAAGGPVRVAVSTGGKSPIMARRIREAIEPAVRDAVTDECLGTITAQETARRLAAPVIATQEARREFLYEVMDDPVTERLIKDKDTTGIQERVMTLLEERRWQAR